MAESDPRDWTDGGGRRLGYESVREERRESLAVEGTLPRWLSGTFVRNGPGRFEVGDRSVDHWFDGLAMLRRFRFRPGDRVDDNHCRSTGHGDDGRSADDGDDGDDRQTGGTVDYANRFLRTDAFAAAREGRIDAQGFAATPDGLLQRVRSALSPSPTDNANADLARVAGEYVALTESPRAVAFDPDDLTTLGELDWDDDLPTGHTTPHLRRDREGGVWGYLTTFLPESAYHLFRVPPDRPKRTVVATVRTDLPAYMHSFELTPEYAVLTEMPFVMPPLKLLSPAEESPFRRFEWRPQRRTRFLVIDRATGEVAAEHRVAPFVVFHHVNAVRRGDELVLDLVAFDSPSVLNGMLLDHLRNAPPREGGGGRLRRYRLPLDGGDPTSETLAEGLALPTIRPDRRGRPYRYVYAQDSRGRGPPRTVAKVDVHGGTRSTWSAGEYVSEPVFVPAPAGGRAGDSPSDDPSDGRSGGDEPGDRRVEGGSPVADPPTGLDDGVVLVETLDPDEGRSAVVVLDAATMTERARARTPHHLPFGFHGQFFPDAGDRRADSPDGGGWRA